MKVRNRSIKQVIIAKDYINHTGVFRNGKMNYIFLSVIRIIPLEDSEKVTTFAPKYVQLKK